VARTSLQLTKASYWATVCESYCNVRTCVGTDDNRPFYSSFGSAKIVGWHGQVKTLGQRMRLCWGVGGSSVIWLWVDGVDGFRVGQVVVCVGAILLDV